MMLLLLPQVSVLKAAVEVYRYAGIEYRSAHKTKVDKEAGLKP